MWIVFQMFDVNGDGNIHLPEFEEITDALQQRLKRVSTMQRTGAHISQYAPPLFLLSELHPPHRADIAGMMEDTAILTGGLPAPPPSPPRKLS